MSTPVDRLLSNIPQYIRGLKQWSPTYPRTSDPVEGVSARQLARYKRPLVPPDPEQYHRLSTLDEAIRLTTSWPTAPNYGLMMTDDSPLAVVDIDDYYAPDGSISPDVSESARDVIQSLTARTYSERSLSGRGVHILLYLTDKDAITTRAYRRAPRGGEWQGQVSVRNNYMICTGDRLPGSPTLVAHLTPADLSGLLGPAPASGASSASSAPASGASSASSAPASGASSASSAPASGASSASLHDALRDYVETGKPLAPRAPKSAEWDAVRDHLSLLTLDRNPRVVRTWEAVTQTEYEHYDYWLRIGMALHAEAVRTDQLALGLQAYQDWSATDPTSYAGPDDVRITWESFSAHPSMSTSQPSSDDQQVTYATILALVRRLVITWPDVVAKTGLPDQSSLANMRTLLEHYALQAYDWPGVGYFIDGDPDIVARYFTRPKPLPGMVQPQDTAGLPVDSATGRVFGLGGPWLSTLPLHLAALAQGQASWRGQHKAYSGDLTATLVELAKPLNPVHRWLTTEPDDQPPVLRQEDHTHSPTHRQNSTFDNFIKAFRFPDSALHATHVPLMHKMLKAMLMQLVRFADPTAQTEPAEGMVILVGPEGCRKTSFFRWLFPSSLSKLHVQWTENATSDKNKRDMGRALAGAGVFLLDECDYVLRGNEVASWLKAILTQNTVGYTELYQSHRVEKVRTALICGTTNNRDIWLSNTDNRRMWLIDVQYIDIEYLEANISRYWLYRNLYAEYQAARQRGERPWVMDPKDFLTLRMANDTMSAKSSLQLDLEDALKIDPSAPLRTKPMTHKELAELIDNPQRKGHPHLCNTAEVKRQLRMRGVHASTLAHTAQLKQVLRRLSENYTGHRSPVTVRPHNVDYRYEGGEVYYADRKAWLLPEWREVEDDG